MRGRRKKRERKNNLGKWQAMSPHKAQKSASFSGETRGRKKKREGEVFQKGQVT